MGTFVDQMLSTLDPKIVYVCMAALAFLAVITILKKAVGLGIIILAIAGCAYFIVPVAQDYQERYSISYSEGVLELTVDGVESTLDASNIANIRDVNVVRGADGDYDMKIAYADGNIQTITFPSFMRQTVVAFMDKTGLEYDLKD